MKINNEAIIGIIVTLCAFVIIAALTGVYGVLYIGLVIIAVAITLNLFFKKSLAAKATAVILNTDILYKLLMPKKYKNAIKELEEKENNEKT